MAKTFPYKFSASTYKGTEIIAKVSVPLPDVAPKKTIDLIVESRLKAWMWQNLLTSWEILDQKNDELQLKFSVATPVPNSTIEEVVELAISNDVDEVAEIITAHYQEWVEKKVTATWEPIIY